MGVANERRLNEVRRGFYLDSVALMRISRELAALPGVEEAALMIGTPSNKAILQEAGLLSSDGERARPDDLVIAVQGKERRGRPWPWRRSCCSVRAFEEAADGDASRSASQPRSQHCPRRTSR